MTSILPDIDPAVIDQIAAAVHDQWMAGQTEQHVVSRLTGVDLMVPYEQLREADKALDLATVGAVLSGLTAAGYRLVRA